MILPPLRRVEVAMTCNMNNFNDKEIAELVKTNPDTLKLEEIIRCFYDTKLNEKAIIYQAVRKPKSIKRTGSL